MYRVEWMRTAEDDLERIYRSKPEFVHEEVRGAVEQAIESLTEDALNEGESRADQDRIFFCAPLVFDYFVVPDAMLAVIFHVRLYGLDI